jgi:hypothetical protein
VRRLVVDPGVLVSALIKREGPPGQLWLAVERGDVDLIVSALLLQELADVLGRAKFRRYVTADEAERFVADVVALGMLVPDPQAVHGVTPDPKDDYLVALAQVAQADALVSGDRAVLGADVPGLSIVTPRTAVEVLP